MPNASQSAYVRSSLLLLAGGLMLLLAIGGGTAWLVLETRNFARRVAETQEFRTALVEALSLFQDAETGQRGYLLTDRQDYLEPYGDAVANLPQALAALRGLAQREGAALRDLDTLRDQGEAKLDELAETLVLAGTGDRDGVLALVQGDRGKRAMDALRAVVARLDAAAADRLAAHSLGLDRAARWLVLGVGAALVLVLAMGAAALSLALRRTRDLDRARRDLALANDGLEMRVQGRTEDLAALGEEVQRFAYIVSHDLRAPLVNILGFTAETATSLEALRAMILRLDRQDPSLVDAEAREAVQQDIPEALRFIRSSSERMDRLINAILKFSREGRRELEPQDLDMDRLVGGLADSLRTQLEAAGATLEVQPGLPSLVADRLALEQILGNLLDNAAKYLDPARPGLVALRGGRQGSTAWFEVADNGRGIDPRDHDRIFDLFRRAGTQDRPGEGIGLAHVRALARRLGGSIRLTSRLGEGASFRLTLPLTPPREDAMQRREALA